MTNDTSAVPALPTLTEQEAHDLDTAITHLLYVVSDTVYKLGAALREMRNRQGYIALGYPSMEQYIKSLKPARRTIYNYLKADECLQKRLRYLNIDAQKLLETPHTNLLQIGHIILDKNEWGQWKYPDETVELWLQKAQELSNDELTKALKDDGVMKPDPLIIKFKPGAAFFRGSVSKDGSWVLTFRRCRPQWDITLQTLITSIKDKGLDITLKADENV